MTLASTSAIDVVPLSVLLEAARDGRLAIPDFQRNYVWSADAVKELLATVLVGWPSGTLLLMPGRPEGFELRKLDGGPELADDIEFTVLDGQQRLTALFQATANAGDFVYALRFDAIDQVDIDDLTQALQAFPRRRWEREFQSPAAQIENSLMPVYILGRPDDYYHWRDSILAAAPPDRMLSLRARLTNIYELLLGSMSSYQYPAVILGAGAEPIEIASVFERLNRTGVRLNAFDLMVARSVSTSWNLREAFTEARSEKPFLKMFLGDDGMPILSTMALAHGSDVRESAILRMRGELVRDRWQSTVEAVDQACRHLWSWGVLNPNYLPYRIALPILSAALLSEVPAARLQAWFWTRSFARAFDVAANTRAVSEYRALIDTRTESVVPPANRDTLWLATRKGDAASYRAFVALMSRELGVSSVAKAPDELDVGADALLQVVRVDRIYERSPITDAGIPLHLKVLNTYLRPIVEDWAPRPELLRRQFIDQDLFRALGPASWRALLLDRLNRVTALLTQEFGLQWTGEIEPPDFAEDELLSGVDDA